MTAVGTAAQSAATAAGPKPRVFYDVGYIDTTGQIYGAAKGSFLAEMLDMLGVDTITGDATTYEVPLETLIERDPQVIILGTNAFYSPTRRDHRQADRLVQADGGQDRRRPFRHRHGDHPAGAAPRHRLPQPCPGDVPGPRPAIAGRVTDAVAGLRWRPEPSHRAASGRHRRPDPRPPGAIAVIGLVVLAISLVAGVTVGSIQIGAPTRWGSSSSARSGSTSAATGRPPRRRSSGSCGCRGS